MSRIPRAKRDKPRVPRSERVSKPPPPLRTGSATWSVTRAALFGAAIGGPAMWFGNVIMKRDLPAEPAQIVGFLLGGAIFFSLACAMAAAVRNSMIER
jgi:hypothetical protein